MARVFTTSFEFNHQRYNAIVTILSQEGQLNFNIRLLDADLHDFFPDGIINYNGTNGFEQLQAMQNSVAQSLVKKVGEAVNKHLLQTL